MEATSGLTAYICISDRSCCIQHSIYNKNYETFWMSELHSSVVRLCVRQCCRSISTHFVLCVCLRANLRLVECIYPSESFWCYCRFVCPSVLLRLCWSVKEALVVLSLCYLCAISAIYGRNCPVSHLFVRVISVLSLCYLCYLLLSLCYLCAISVLSLCYLCVISVLSLCYLCVISMTSSKKKNFICSFTCFLEA
jgi:hypothetical protein